MFDVLIEHGHNANGEVSGNTAADLKETYGGILDSAEIPLPEFDHIFYSGAHRMHVGDCSRDAACGVDISERRILPSRDEHRKVLLRSGHDPAVRRVNLIKLRQSIV